FNRKGVIIVSAEEADEEAILLATMDAGAEEVKESGEKFEIVSEATDLVDVRTALVDAGIDYDSADASFVPELEVDLDAETARKACGLADAVAACEEVQNVYTTADLSDEVLAGLDA